MGNEPIGSDVGLKGWEINYKNDCKKSYTKLEAWLSQNTKIVYENDANRMGEPHRTLTLCSDLKC